MSSSKLLSKFNKRANQWLLELKELDEEFTLQRPDEKTWCIAEVYDHVMRVARHYQIPNMKTSLTDSARRKKRKNYKGYAIFDIGYRQQVTIQMERFPQPLVEAFTPQKRNKPELIEDFELFIKEVNALEEIVNSSSRSNKHYHPMFGDISTKDWFALIELHMWNHERQKERIKRNLMNES